jgi:hypothetical protein
VELEEEEEVFGEPADFGEEQADEAEPSDVPPLEFDTRDTEDHSGSFHVGTLAELAQMDARGVPIESELHDDAIELESSASSLASLGPRIAPKSQDIPDIEEEDSLDSIPAIPDIDETPEEEEAPILEPVQLKPVPRQVSLSSIGAERIAPLSDAIRNRVDEAAGRASAQIEGITSAQAAAIQTLTREIIERVVWEVVPDLAEAIIKEELSKLLKE